MPTDHKVHIANIRQGNTVVKVFRHGRQTVLQLVSGSLARPPCWIELLQYVQSVAIFYIPSVTDDIHNAWILLATDGKHLRCFKAENGTPHPLDTTLFLCTIRDPLFLLKQSLSKKSSAHGMRLVGHLFNLSFPAHTVLQTHTFTIDHFEMKSEFNEPVFVEDLVPLTSSHVSRKWKPLQSPTTGYMMDSGSAVLTSPPSLYDVAPYAVYGYHNKRTGNKSFWLFVPAQGWIRAQDGMPHPVVPRQCLSLARGPPRWIAEQSWKGSLTKMDHSRKLSPINPSRPACSCVGIIRKKLCNGMHVLARDMIGDIIRVTLVWPSVVFKRPDDPRTPAARWNPKLQADGFPTGYHLEHAHSQQIVPQPMLPYWHDRPGQFRSSASTYLYKKVVEVRCIRRLRHNVCTGCYTSFVQPFADQLILAARCLKQIQPTHQIVTSDAQVSQCSRIHMQVHAQHRWDFDRALLPYLPDPHGFRMLMAETRTIISGIFALAFLHGHTRETTVLDVLSPSINGSRVLHYFLHRGYSIHSSQPFIWINSHTANSFATFDLHSDSIHSVFNLQRGAAHVRLILCKEYVEPSAMIFEAPSTCLMNFITWNKAFCLYPGATLVQRASLLVQHRVGPHPARSPNELFNHDYQPWIFAIAESVINSLGVCHSLSKASTIE
ncbi:hypothetical protein CALCODRAFT_506080 [Calocera cornea HHB12733]|uniref:Uncharacterized protein n=1 Tax=Calocera cornea HHB12733 TaxID=1353952 RepID=A0A165JF14_9BASI|nr:hypothetical protein CALCODRAFT_506080 [Calocera cornea HHB12733]